MSSAVKPPTFNVEHIAANACRRGRCIPRSHIVRRRVVTRIPPSSSISVTRRSRWPLRTRPRRIRPPGRRKRSTFGSCRCASGPSTLCAPCSHAAVRSVTTASGGTTSRRHASRSSRQSTSWAAYSTPCNGDTSNPAFTPARRRRGSTPWARAQLEVNGRSMGRGPALVRKVASVMDTHVECPLPPTSKPPDSRPVDNPRSPSRHVPTRRVFDASLRRVGVSGGRSPWRTSRRTRSSRRSRW